LTQARRVRLTAFAGHGAVHLSFTCQTHRAASQPIFSVHAVTLCATRQLGAL
jgi:hypothetical protein